MQWSSLLLPAGALCIACVQPPLLSTTGDKAGTFDPADEEVDDDGCGDADESSGDCTDLWPETPCSPETAFMALPDVHIYVLDYPGGFAGQAAWFADDVDSGCIRYAFYVTEASDGMVRGRATASLRDFQRICGSLACRRGSMSEVEATWATQLARWTSHQASGWVGTALKAV